MGNRLSFALYLSNSSHIQFNMPLPIFEVANSRLVTAVVPQNIICSTETSNGLLNHFIM